tara:strand:+ start:113 stop:454 length:342 start_codon:yes stop_codon:yes gene_type:complete
MALALEIKAMRSPDYDGNELPKELDNCEVFIELDVGSRGTSGADMFSISVVTPKYMLDNPERNWGKGYLVMNSFSWDSVEKTLQNMIDAVEGNSWDEVAKLLCVNFNWEFEDY